MNGEVDQGQDRHPTNDVGGLPDDRQLLQAYAAEGSQQAFAQLVSRHLDFVYSCCLRQMHDHHVAEDLTQAVFLALARKARQLPPATILNGWLFKAARYACSNARKMQARRQNHEQRAGQMRSETHTPEESCWPEMAPLLDEALDRLRPADRDAVLLRYIEGKELSEVARQLGASPEATKKRVARAVAKLRGLFARRGVSVPATAIGAALTAYAVQPAPPALAASVTAVAMGTAGASAASMLVLSSSKAIASSLALGHLKMVASIVLLGLLLLGGSVAGVRALTGGLASGASPTTVPAVKALRATLANGTVVELAGVCSHSLPSQPWWTPDGIVLSPGRFDRHSGGIPPRADEQSLEFALRVSNVPGASVNAAWQIAQARSANGRVPIQSGQSAGDMLWVRGSFPKDLATTTLRFGQEEDNREADSLLVLDRQGKPIGLPTPLGQSLFLPAETGRGSNSRSTFLAFADQGEEPLVQLSERGLAIVREGRNGPPVFGRIWPDAILSNGEEFGPIAAVSLPAVAGTGRRTAILYGVPLEQVERFRIRVKPYRCWVTFRDIALRPGQQTAAKVEVEELTSPSSATLADGTVVEFLGLCPQPAAGQRWWAPDGAPITAAPFDTCGGRVRPAPGERSLEAAIRIRPAPAAGVAVAWDFSKRRGLATGAGCFKAGQLIPDMAGTAVSFPKDQATTTLRFGMTGGTQEWQTVLRLDRQGKPIGQPMLSGPGLFLPAEVGQRNGEAVLTLTEGPAAMAFFGTHSVEMRAFLVNGKPRYARGFIPPAVGEGGGQERLLFGVPPDAIDHFEIRARPYHAWITFRNVSLRPGQPTQVQVSVEEMPAGQPGWRVTLPTGGSVELLGVSRYPSQGQAWWDPGGSPMAAAPYTRWDGVTFVDPRPVRHELAVRLEGFAVKPGVTWQVTPGTIDGDSDVPPTRGLWPLLETRCAVAAFPPGTARATVRLGLATDAPELLTLDTTGKPAGNVAGSMQRWVPYRVIASGTKTLLVLPGAMSELDAYDYDIQAISQQRIWYPALGPEQAMVGRPRAAFVFDLPQAQISSFQIKARPWRYWLVFRNVSLESGKATDVRAEVEEALPAPRQP